MKMKYFSGVLVIFALYWVSSVAKSALQERIEQRRITTACLSESRAGITVPFKLAKGDFTDRSDKVQCFVKCYLLRNEIIDEDGIFQVPRIDEELEKYMKDKDIVAIRDKCVAVEGDNLCDKSFKLCECFWNEAYGDNQTVPATARFDFIARPFLKLNKEKKIKVDVVMVKEEA